jgi:UDP-N-acetylmuramoyl-L-alanyl-D-glutamate--2,6-diaminopimelate ligase
VFFKSGNFYIMFDKILHRIRKIMPEKLWNYLWPIYHFSWGVLGNWLYRWPSQKLIVIGVTGTTGKTTSVYLIAKTLAAAGYKVGYTSTAMFSDGNKEWLNNKKMTMVGRLFTFRLLHRMVKNKCHYGVIETSSEGIIQYRHRFINYDLLVFTGLYPEHIEAHGSFEAYKEAKGMLFAHLKDCKTKYVDNDRRVKKVEAGIKKLSLNRVKKTIIVNGDDELKDYFENFWSETKIEYQITAKLPLEIGPADFAVKDHNFHRLFAASPVISREGTEFVLCYDEQCFKDNPVTLKLLGGFNVANAMNAAAVGYAQGLSLEQIIKGLESVAGIPGRLERINEGQPFTVIVDYAFEPRAVEKLYETIVLLPHDKVIQVLGSAGGGRDEARRPVLGRIAGEQADTVIVTDEDPYDEDPYIIIDQVALGAEKAGKVLERDLFKIIDRRQAIAQALAKAQPNDIVLITGKGSEQAICVKGGKKIPWDDRTVVREELKRIL